MNNKFRKNMLVAALAAAGLTAGFTASAADGDKLLDVNFETAVVGQTVEEYKAGATTDFKLTTLFGQ